MYARAASIIPGEKSLSVSETVGSSRSSTTLHISAGPQPTSSTRAPEDGASRAQSHSNQPSGFVE